MARVLPPFFSASLATRATSRRPARDLQPVERGLRAGLGLHAADVAAPARTSPPAFSTLTASRAARTATAGSVSDAPARRNADQSIASRSDRPTDSTRRSLIRAGLARGLDHREPDAGRRRRAEARIGPGRDHDADAGQAQHQLVGRAATDVAAALAHRIANIAEHEQVAECGAGKARPRRRARR